VLPLLWYRRLSIVNPSAKIGRNCRVHAGGNIGAAVRFTPLGDTSRRAPVIGHNCYIGPGAKIFGPVTIGNCCVIGANAVVNKSFEMDNITLGGIPARVIDEDGSVGNVKPALR
jgi:serine O-acetyltransferase